MPDAEALALYSIGHSTRPIEAFVAMLRAHGVLSLVDIRTVPRSRHNPQFGQEALTASLEESGIAYLHMPGLGGLRRPRVDSTNTAWQNASFRGYADYMQTPAFAAEIDRLLTRARERPTAIMCAEGVPWRCHRSLVADALIARGVEVREIESATRFRRLQLTPWARVSGTAVTYPGVDAE